MLTAQHAHPGSLGASAHVCSYRPHQLQEGGAPEAPSEPGKDPKAHVAHFLMQEGSVEPSAHDLAAGPTLHGVVYIGVVGGGGAVRAGIDLRKASNGDDSQSSCPASPPSCIRPYSSPRTHSPPL